MADLPSWLVEAVEGRLEGRSRGDLLQRSARLSAAYRQGGTSSAAVRGEEDAIAYAVARMPATFAAVSRVLAEVRDLLPDFSPRSVLDAGAGPGTAGFAAAELWRGATDLTQADHNAAFLALARGFAGSGGRKIRQVEAELARLPAGVGRFDLVVLGYVLAEFGRDDAADLAERLWPHAAGALVLVEPGTPDGYARVVAARARLIAAGARILAPCPHEVACPLTPPDWCHFAERLARRRAHMAAKGASLPFEDEKFSYLVAVRGAFVPRTAEARIIASPDASKAGIRLRLCRTDGSVASETVPRRDKPRFAVARRLDWGDRLAPLSSDEGAIGP